MTVLSKDPVINIIPGNNTGDFAFTFRGFSEIPGTNAGIKTIQVFVWSGNPADAPVQQIQGTDYTVLQVNNETGTIRFTNSRTIPSGQFVIIYSDVPYTQELSFPTNQPVNPASVELMGDRLAMEIKQLYELYKTTISTGYPPISTDFEVVLGLPLEEGKPLVFQKLAGNKWEVTTSALTIPDFTNLANQATQAAQQAATSATNAQQASATATASVTAATNAVTAAQAAQAAAQAAQTAAQAAQTGAQTAATNASGSATAAQAAQTAVEALKQDVQALASTFPDPTGQPANQVLLTDGNNGYTFGSAPGIGAGNFLEFINVPAGATLVDTLDLTNIGTQSDGIYGLALEKTGNNLVVRLTATGPGGGLISIKTPTTVLYNGVSDTTPLRIATANPATIEVYIGNRTDKSIYLGPDSAILAATPTQGIEIPPGTRFKSNFNTDLFVISGDGTGPATGTVAVTTTTRS